MTDGAGIMVMNAAADAVVSDAAGGRNGEKRKEEAGGWEAERNTHATSCAGKAERRSKSCKGVVAEAKSMRE
jgi:hypothetical protein